MHRLLAAIFSSPFESRKFPDRTDGLFANVLFVVELRRRRNARYAREVPTATSASLRLPGCQASLAQRHCITQNGDMHLRSDFNLLSMCCDAIRFTQPSAILNPSAETVNLLCLSPCYSAQPQGSSLAHPSHLPIAELVSTN
jgi:hypothetical protein